MLALTCTESTNQDAMDYGSLDMLDELGDKELSSFCRMGAGIDIVQDPLILEDICYSANHQLVFQEKAPYYILLYLPSFPSLKKLWQLINRNQIQEANSKTTRFGDVSSL